MPFFFYPVKVTKVLLGLSYFKKHAKLRYGALLGAYSGLGAGLSGLLALRRRIAAGLSGYEYSVEKAFDDWADRIFDDCLPDYGVAMRSDATTLNILHPPDNPASLGSGFVERARNVAPAGCGQDGDTRGE